MHKSPMQESHPFRRSIVPFTKRRLMSSPLRFLTLALLVISLGCAFPTIQTSTPTPAVTIQVPTARPQPTPTQMPLPPTLVASDPPRGVEIPLAAPVTLYFNQPMDRASVEAATRFLAGGGQQVQKSRLTWKNDTTLTFTPDTPLPPETQLAVSVNQSARSAQGLPLTEPISLTYRTVGYLRLTQTLPEKEAQDVDPSSAIVVAFNRPVVPLGADPATLPQAFTLSAGQGAGATSSEAPAGRSEWINTSTYVFYPDPPLAGGKTYAVTVNPDLHGADGSPLEAAAQNSATAGTATAPVYQWSFTTAMPRLLSVDPAQGNREVLLDPDVVLTFNQPMDIASVEANFRLAGPDGVALPGKFSWNDKLTVATFKPDGLLARSTSYAIVLNGQAQSRGGTPLGAGLVSSVQTVPNLAVRSTEPVAGQVLNPYGNLSLFLTAPITETSLSSSLTISPTVPDLSHGWDAQNLALIIFGSFAPNTNYTLALSTDLKDIWGGSLAQPFIFNFRTAPLPPGLILGTGSDVIFLTPQDPSIQVQATNIFNVPLTVSGVPLDDFFRMLGPNSYDARQSYQPVNPKTWDQLLGIAPGSTQPAELFVSPDMSPLAPGLYYMKVNLSQEGVSQSPFLLVVSNTQMTFKLSATDALVWAMDLRTNTPLPNMAVRIVGEDGKDLASGQTDAQGIFRAALPPAQDPYRTAYAILGQPGDDTFGMVLPTWTQGIESWQFGIPFDNTPPHLKAYFYSDRPIYRPGQTVYYRVIARQAYNGRYTSPDVKSLPLTLYGNNGEEISSFDLPLTAYGTGHGEITLPPDARPGSYRLASSALTYDSLNFQVADYRKPEINLSVNIGPEQVQAGQTLSATVDAHYFFGAPAGNVPLHWVLYAAPASFDLPGYQVGTPDLSWLQTFPSLRFGLPPLGTQVAEGDASTNPYGMFSLSLPTNLEADDQNIPAALQQPGQPRKLTLEVTVQDESGLPVSARGSALVHPAGFYVGAAPDAWVGRAGDQAGFAVQVANWDQSPAGARSLRAEFQKVTYVVDPSIPVSRFGGPNMVAQYTPLGSTDFSTNEQGQARVAFTPPDPGPYLVSFHGLKPGEEGAYTAILWSVGGPGQAVWPNLPNQRLRLTANQSTYRPGDTAQVYVPNPFNERLPALATVERGTVLRQQVVTIEPGGSNLSFPLTSDDAPNVYVSLTLLRRDTAGHPDFRQGYVELPVEPEEQVLNVSLASQPELAGPGEPVTFDILVTDNAGTPVQGEFSLSVVDLAALALADANAPEIVPAFYGKQSLGVSTSLDLAGYARRQSIQAPGMGGGGGETVASVVRENFPDTAYWNAEVVTGPDGRAQVSVTLPDTLTTWQVDTRGLTADTRVGEAQTQVLTTKDLLIRPVTPRFVVANDHVLLAAVVQNNTGSLLDVEASLQASGFNLDDPATAAQTVSVPPAGRTRVEWWGTVQDVDSLDLVFSAKAGEFQDSARPSAGALPVRHYTARQAFLTSGTLDQAGERLELVSLPPSDLLGNAPEALSGSLSVELSPSLGAAMVNALDALEAEPGSSTEAAVSRFLPNLEAYRAAQQFGVQSPALQSRLQRTLDEALQSLLGSQNSDGGWAWWQAGSGDQASDPYLTAYVLLGLSRAREAGISVSETAQQRAVKYLQDYETAQPALPTAPDVSLATWQLDRLVFQDYALTMAGSGDLNRLNALYDLRDLLNPWSQALLSLAFEHLAPNSEEARTLISNLETQAVRSASGVQWALKGDDQAYFGDQQNMITPLTNSAIVIYALAQRDPGSPLLVDAVRYLMANRQANGSWSSTYASAWTLQALTEFMKGTGELGGDFAFGATLNGAPLASGQAAGPEQLTPVMANAPIASLYPTSPNALLIQRQPGPGRLYYTAALNLNRPVESVAPLQQGMTVDRAYYLSQGADTVLEGPPLHAAQVGQRVTVRLSLTVTGDVYYLVLEDYIPGGSEILDTRLKTSAQGEGDGTSAQVVPDPSRPFAQGWGAWYFHQPELYDDHITWSADHLAPGTYELTYTLEILQPGQYRVLPAQARQAYFPDVQGNSAGEVFEIKP